LAGCGHSKAADANSLTFLIESNPTNLDPRFAPATSTSTLHLVGRLTRLSPCIQISTSSSGLSASGKTLHVLTIDSGLNEPNANREEPDQEKWTSVIVERRWLARLCHNQILGNKV
jgi:hypothetical protein